MVVRRILIPSVLLGVSLAGCCVRAQIVADNLAGADIGAKINSADRSLGSRCGSIEIDSPGTAATPVTLSTCHSLKLSAPVTWTATIALPQGSSGQTITCSKIQALSFNPVGAWVAGTSVSNVTIDGCSVTGSNTRGPVFLLASITAGNNIKITHNTLTNAVLLVTGSSAPPGACDGNPPCAYPNVSAANSTNGVVVENNSVHNINYLGTAVTLGYTNQASVANNVFDGVDTGLEWWGGDSCIAGGGCTAGQNGAIENPRKLSHLKVANNTISAKSSCVWGSMGQYVDVASNSCSGIDSGDVGLDAEGSFDVVFEHNSVHGYKNGDLAVFWLSTRVSFDSNDATQDDSSLPLFALQNETQVAAGLTVSFTNNHFACLDKRNSCSTRSGAFETITVDNNHFLNTRLELDANNENRVEIRSNDFLFTTPAAAAIRVHGYNRSAGLANNGYVEVGSNSILSNCVQAAGSQGILAIGDDFNAPQQTIIRANVLGGSSPFPIDIECDSNTGNSPSQSNFCTLTDNVVARNRIVTGTGGHGAVQATQSNNHVAGKSKN